MNDKRISELDSVIGLLPNTIVEVVQGTPLNNYKITPELLVSETQVVKDLITNVSGNTQSIVDINSEIDSITLQIGDITNDISNIQNELVDVYTKTETDNLLDGKSDSNHLHTGVYQPIMGSNDNYVTDDQITSINTIGNKVDKVSGKELYSDNQADARAALRFTEAEKTKLSGVESNKFVGQFTSEAALFLVVGTQGQYAYVDLGVGQDVAVYAWDTNDTKWVLQKGITTAETPATIKLKYESNADTNAFTDALETKLNSVASGAQVNVIETIQKNGVTLSPTSKTVNITVPTQASDISAEPANANIQTHISDTTTRHLNATSQTIGGVKTFTDGIITNHVEYDTTPSIPTSLSSTYWDAANRTLSTILGNGVVLQNGQEMYVKVVNKTGVDITDGSVVYINGAQGNRPTVALAIANSENTSYVIGVATETILINQEGLVTVFGSVSGFNTSTYTDGAKLYLSSTNAGQLTTTKPVAPNHSVVVGIALNSTNNGSIFIHPTDGYELGELHDVDLTKSKTTPIDADNLLIQDSADSDIWKNVTFEDIKQTILSSQNNVTLDPTGFQYPNLTVVTGNGDRTITLSGTVEAYWRGILVPTLTSGYVSPIHGTDTSKLYFLSYDGSTISWSETVWTFDKLQIALAKYDATNGVWFYFREVHGLNMPWSVHREMHNNFGTYKSNGGTIPTASYVIDSTTASERRPNIDETTIDDEDLPTVLPALTSKLYTQFRLNGADVAVQTLESSDIVSLSTNNPYYNQLTGGLWQQTLLPSNSVATVWIYALPTTSDAISQKYRYLFVQPQSFTQSTNSSANAINTAVLTEKNKLSSELNLNGLISTEIVAIAKAIIVYTSGNWFIREVNLLSGTKYAQIGSQSTTAVTLNAAYLNSQDPEIETTIGAVTLKGGVADNTVNVLEVKNFSGVLKSSINANGSYENIADFGSNEAPLVYDSSNWALTSGWVFDGNSLDKNAAGTTTSTALLGVAPIAQQVYKMTFTVANSIGTGTFVGNVIPSFAGTAFSAITAVGTYTYYIHAVSTAKLVFTPSTTNARFNISDISIVKRTDLTADVKVGGDVFFNGNRILNSNTNTPIFYWYPNGSTYVVGTFNMISSTTCANTLTARQLATTTGTAATTTGAISLNLNTNGNYYLSAALTGTITVTTSSPATGAKTHLFFTQGATAQIVNIAQSGVTFRQTGTTNTGSGTIALQNISTVNAFYKVMMDWASTTVCYITVM